MSVTQHGLAVVGPLTIRRFELERVCDAWHGHAHEYDHVTRVTQGRVQVIYREPAMETRRHYHPKRTTLVPTGQFTERESAEYGPGACIFIAAQLHHTIKALVPNTKYQCEFEHRDFDGTVVQEYQGNPDEAEHRVTNGGA